MCFSNALYQSAVDVDQSRLASFMVDQRKTWYQLTHEILVELIVYKDMCKFCAKVYKVRSTINFPGYRFSI